MYTYYMSRMKHYDIESFIKALLSKILSELSLIIDIIQETRYKL